MGWVWVLLVGRSEAVQVPIDRASLCAKATLVVVAEVTGTEGRFTQAGTIETHADLAVATVVRGRAPESVTVAVPGGRAGGLRMAVSEAPVLRADARYLLFLAPRTDGAWSVVGGEQGAVLVPWEADAARVAEEACRAS